MLRFSPLLFLVLSACASGPAEVPPHDPAADRLLAQVTGSAWDDAFARHPAPPALQITEQFASGEPHADRRDVAADSLVNPLPSFLSDEPPYLDAAAREQYRTVMLGDTTVAGRAALLVEARFVAGDGRRTQPIRYVRAAVDAASGALLAVTVRREVESTLYDETSRLDAALSLHGGALVPGHATVETRTDVPLSPPRHSRVRWRVLS